MNTSMKVTLQPQSSLALSDAQEKLIAIAETMLRYTSRRSNIFSTVWGVKAPESLCQKLVRVEEHQILCYGYITLNTNWTEFELERYFNEARENCMLGFHNLGNPKLFHCITDSKIYARESTTCFPIACLVSINISVEICLSNSTELFYPFFLSASGFELLSEINVKPPFTVTLFKDCCPISENDCCDWENLIDEETLCQRFLSVLPGGERSEGNIRPISEYEKWQTF